MARKSKYTPETVAKIMQAVKMALLDDWRATHGGAATDNTKGITL